MTRIELTRVLDSLGAEDETELEFFSSSAHYVEEGVEPLAKTFGLAPRGVFVKVASKS